MKPLVWLGISNTRLASLEVTVRKRMSTGTTVAPCGVHRMKLERTFGFDNLYTGLDAAGNDVF